MSQENAVYDTTLRNAPMVWGVAGVAAAVLTASALELNAFRQSLPLRALVMAAGIVPAAFVFTRLAPAGTIDHTNRRRVLFAILCVHVLATLYFFPPADILNDRPVVTLDHSFHYYQAVRTREAFWDTMRFDRYDPYFMAGYPGGTIFDLDMKGAETFCALIPGIGVARALKLFILCAYLTMIPALYWGSRMQGFRIRESVLGVLVFLVYWHWGRPYAGDFRYAGMFSFILGANLCFLLVGLLRRAARGAFKKTFLGLGPVAFLVHPTAVVMLPVPFAVALGIDRRLWLPRRWLLLAVWCAAVLFVNSAWLLPFFDYVWMKTTTELYYQVHGWEGLVGVLCKPSCAVALTLMGLALVGLVRMSKQSRLTAAMPAAATAAFLICVAAAGGAVPGIRQLEPGRFLFGGFVFAAPLAGAGVQWLLDVISGIIRAARLRQAFRSAAVVGMALSILPLSLLESKSFYRHTLRTEWSPRVAGLVDAVVSKVRRPGRLMIEDCAAMYYDDVHLPALLPLLTGVEQIGGPYPHTFLLYYFASFRWEQTFGQPMEQWDRDSFQLYLELYNVRWVVTASERAGRVVTRLLEAEPDWAEPPYAMWTVSPYADEEYDVPSTRPRVVDAGMNRLLVRGDGSSDGFFIEYHWVPGLAASGAARLRPIHRLGDPVPFIFVEPNGESEITIGY